MMEITHEVLDLRGGTSRHGTDQGSSKMLGEISDQAAKLMGEAVRNVDRRR